MKNILIIGGTRNMGYYLTLRLLEEGHRVTILNRGMSKDDLPESVPRLRADRTDPQQLRRALMGKSFDVVVDFVVYKGHEAETMIELLDGDVDHPLPHQRQRHRQQRFGPGHPRRGIGKGQALVLGAARIVPARYHVHRAIGDRPARRLAGLLQRLRLGVVAQVRDPEPRLGRGEAEALQPDALGAQDAFLPAPPTPSFPNAPAAP